MHGILGQDIPRVTLLVQERAPVRRLILTRHPLQEKLAVFRTPERSMHQPPVKHELINREDSYSRFSLTAVRNIGGVAHALVLRLEGFVLVVQRDL